jgi:hypothetical protein
MPLVMLSAVPEAKHLNVTKIKELTESVIAIQRTPMAEKQSLH